VWLIQASAHGAVDSYSWLDVRQLGLMVFAFVFVFVLVLVLVLVRVCRVDLDAVWYQACKELLLHNRCNYYAGALALSVRVMRVCGTLTGHDVTLPLQQTVSEVWDIEELVSNGELHTGCPYFASRELKTGAQIVFCPYNYIIDPVIRQAMEVDLTSAVRGMRNCW